MIQLYNELVSHLTNGPPIAWNLKDLAEEFLALKRKNNEDTSGIDDFMYSLNEKEESWYLYYMLAFYKKIELSPDRHNWSSQNVGSLLVKAALDSNKGDSSFKG